MRLSSPTLAETTGHTVASRTEVCLWLTPKVFADIHEPREGAAAFFDHYASWVGTGDRLVLNFCSGNGDHVLNYRGRDHWSDGFDWARYNCYSGSPETHRAHTLNWLKRVREGGERSFNPYNAGPAFIVSDQRMDYAVLARIYSALRAESSARGIERVLLEYLEPGPEFCASTWKTQLHPEGALGSADAGGTIAAGVIDVCSRLLADERAYAAYPAGIPDGESTGTFVARQTAAFVGDFGLDGIFLGNQFGLLGFWHPDNAPEPTPERRTGITAFFRAMRDELGTKLIYWMDTYWPADIEESAWAMDPENFTLVDAVLCSNFAVLAERTQIEPNLRSRFALRERLEHAPRVLFSFDFVDPWYWYRTYLDDRENFLFQHKVFARLGDHCDGVTFFANDTFGHFVMEHPLAETEAAVRTVLD